MHRLHISGVEVFICTVAGYIFSPYNSCGKDVLSCIRSWDKRLLMYGCGITVFTRTIEGLSIHYEIQYAHDTVNIRMAYCCECSQRPNSLSTSVIGVKAVPCRPSLHKQYNRVCALEWAINTGAGATNTQPLVPASTHCYSVHYMSPTTPCASQASSC